MIFAVTDLQGRFVFPANFHYSCSIISPDGSWVVHVVMSFDSSMGCNYCKEPSVFTGVSTSSTGSTKCKSYQTQWNNGCFCSFSHNYWTTPSFYPPISTFLPLVSVVDPLSRSSDLMHISHLNSRPAAVSRKAIGGHNSTVSNCIIKAADLKRLKGSKPQKWI